MKGERKPFDNGLHKRYDKVAKDIVLRHLNKRHPGKWYENPDRYGIDLITDEGRGIDVEFKTWWLNTDEFPFETINVLERKRHLLDDGHEIYICNITCNRALVITRDDVLYKRATELPNRYMKSGELFYQVPAAELKLIRMETLW